MQGYHRATDLIKLVELVLRLSNKDPVSTPFGPTSISLKQRPFHFSSPRSVSSGMLPSDFNPRAPLFNTLVPGPRPD